MGMKRWSTIFLFFASLAVLIWQQAGYPARYHADDLRHLYLAEEGLEHLVSKIQDRNSLIFDEIKIYIERKEFNDKPISSQDSLILKTAQIIKNKKNDLFSDLEGYMTNMRAEKLLLDTLGLPINPHKNFYLENWEQTYPKITNYIEEISQISGIPKDSLLSGIEYGLIDNPQIKNYLKRKISYPVLAVCIRILQTEILEAESKALLVFGTKTDTDLIRKIKILIEPESYTVKLGQPFKAKIGVGYDINNENLFTMSFDGLPMQMENATGTIRIVPKMPAASANGKVEATIGIHSTEYKDYSMFKTISYTVIPK